MAMNLLTMTLREVVEPAAAQQTVTPGADDTSWPAPYFTGAWTAGGWLITVQQSPIRCAAATKLSNSTGFRM
jgi:hypothetical protein